MFKKGFNLKIVLLALAAAISVSFLDARTHGMDLFNKSCLRNPLSFSSELEKARQACMFLALEYQKIIINQETPLSPREAFVKVNFLKTQKEKSDNISGPSSINIKRHKDGLWIYYDADKKEDSFFIFMNNDGGFESRAMEEFNKMRLYDSYVYNNAPEGISKIETQDMKSELTDNRTFIAVPGLLLATGKVSYVDYAPGGREIVFIDEVVYSKYKDAIDSGWRQPEDIGAEDFPNQFMPEGHLNRAARLLSQVRDKIKTKPELLGYVNQKRREIAEKRGVEIKDLEYEELDRIAGNTNFICLDKSPSYAQASPREGTVRFSLAYLSLLTDGEFEVVFSHELAHLMADATVPYSDTEEKLFNLTERFFGGEDKNGLKKEFSPEEAAEISRIWIAREDIADSIAVRITRYTGQFSVFLNKTSEVKIDRDADTRRQYEFFGFLGIQTHPMDLLRGCFAIDFEEIMRAQLKTEGLKLIPVETVDWSGLTQSLKIFKDLTFLEVNL